MAISLAALSLPPAPPVASLTLLTGSSGSIGYGWSSPRVARSPSSARPPPLLHNTFFSSPSGAISFPSSFSGVSLGISFGCARAPGEKRRGLQVRAGKETLCMTKRNRSRKSLARTHGFRRRMRTPTGRAVLRRRRAKGRKVLCTRSNPSSGKRA